MTDITEILNILDLRKFNLFKNAVEKLHKFYEINLSDISYSKEIMKVLTEIVSYDCAAVYYITPNNLNYQFGSGENFPQELNISEGLSSIIYNTQENFDDNIKLLLNSNKEILVSRLSIKGAVFGILIICRDVKFSQDELVIFQACSCVISSLIKDLELSKVLKMQVEALQSGIIETNKAYETIKKQNKKIKENEKLQNEFIANISHDLRTPLNSIIGFSEVLSAKLFGDLTPKQAEYVDDIKLSGIRLLGMINEVLDISKIESNTVKLNLSEVDVNMLISEVCNILKPLADKKGVNIIKKLDDEIVLNGDFIKLQQVIFNIVGNAIKFSPEKSKVIISAQIKENNVIIKIKDNGIGIAKKYHRKIFDKFFQVENSMSKSELSTGLGLTISHEFVKLHGGSIKVISDIGAGAEFIITIKKCRG